MAEVKSSVINVSLEPSLYQLLIAWSDISKSKSPSAFIRGIIIDRLLETGLLTHEKFTKITK